MNGALEEMTCVRVRTPLGFTSVSALPGRTTLLTVGRVAATSAFELRRARRRMRRAVEDAGLIAGHDADSLLEGAQSAVAGIGTIDAVALLSISPEGGQPACEMAGSPAPMIVANGLGVLTRQVAVLPDDWTVVLGTREGSGGVLSAGEVRSLIDAFNLGSKAILGERTMLAARWAGQSIAGARATVEAGSPVA